MQKLNSIPVGSRCLYLVLEEEQRKKGKGFSVSISELALLVGVSTGTVIRNKRKLVELGLLEEVKGHDDYGMRAINKYTVKEVQ